VPGLWRRPIKFSVAGATATVDAPLALQNRPLLPAGALRADFPKRESLQDFLWASTFLCRNDHGDALLAQNIGITVINYLGK